MPESMNQVSRMGTAVNGSGGFWIRRGPSLATARKRRGTLRGSTDNKENVTPTWAVRRHHRSIKSPLPVWYPRTPLRDITVIVNALERTRMRARAARRRHRQNQEPALSPRPEISQVQQTQDANHTPPSLSLASEISAASPNLTSTSSSPLSSMARWQESPDSVFPSTETAIARAAASSSQPKILPSIEYEQKLDSSIDEIEKVVMKNLKKTPQAPPKKATRALMSMR